MLIFQNFFQLQMLTDEFRCWIREPWHNAQTGRRQPVTQCSNILLKARHVGVDTIGYPARESQSVAIDRLGAQQRVIQTTKPHGDYKNHGAIQFFCNIGEGLPFIQRHPPAPGSFYDHQVNRLHQHASAKAGKSIGGQPFTRLGRRDMRRYCGHQRYRIYLMVRHLQRNYSLQAQRIVIARAIRRFLTPRRDGFYCGSTQSLAAGIRQDSAAYGGLADFSVGSGDKKDFLVQLMLSGKKYQVLRA